MSAPELIALVENCGGRVSLHGGGIKLTARKPLPDDLVARLKGAKPEIVLFLQRQEIAICGQCAVTIGPDQEFLHIVADGFPGFIHLDCYDDWFAAHLAGRYAD